MFNETQYSRWQEFQGSWLTQARNFQAESQKHYQNQLQQYFDLYKEQQETMSQIYNHWLNNYQQWQEQGLKANREFVESLGNSSAMQTWRGFWMSFFPGQPSAPINTD
ncbi:MAG TPA: hypothetical protein GX404_00205 [Syntrophomonadaceae bacterium]|nr:hypothetical protein [Syntrophomonadaceae bacterium]